MRRLAIHPGAAGLYIFFLYVLYLSSSYFGAIFHFLYVASLMVGAVSVLALVSTVRSLSVSQSINSDRPAKGDRIEYRFSTIKRTGFPGVPVWVAFHHERGGLALDASPVGFYPSAQRRFETTRVVPVPYRGEYTVGVGSLELTGFLGLVSVRLPASTLSFLVYPRVIEVSRVPFIGHESALCRPGLLRGREEDPTLVDSLVEYRAGLPVRHIAWKKFAALGTPVLKTYGSSSRPGVTIYLDTRRRGPLGESSQASEDCSIEILIALVKFYTTIDIPVSVYGDGLERYEFDGDEGSLFHRLHYDTIGIRFESVRSPAELFFADSGTARYRSSAVLFITEQMDPEILTLSEFGAGDAVCSVVMNLSGYSHHDRAEAAATVDPLRERGALVHIVRGVETIREDLEQ